MGETEMKGKMLAIISIIVIAIPWIFLLEVLPISYSGISTQAEVIMESGMFVLVAIIVTLLRKEMKRQKSSGTESKGDRTIVRILFVLASVTLFLIGLILVLIALSFSL